MSYQVRNAKRALRDTFEARNVNERDEVFAETSHHAAGGIGFSTIEVLQAFCEVNNLQVDWADEYGEPGYSDAPKGIFFCNWNHVPKSLQKRLEAQGVEMEWSDEWYVDSDKSPTKAWRTSPDGYGWESRVRMMDGYYITPDSDAQEWIDSSLNEQDTPLPSWFDESELTNRGFAEINQDDKEVGFHPGQNETPDKFVPALRKEGYDVILQVTDRGQFDVRYKIWTRREAKRELFLSDSRGIYIPRDFAQCVERDKVTGVTDENYATLEAGPDHEWYWEAWEEVLNGAVLTRTDGTVFRLEQDGDLWLVESAGEFCEHEDKYYTHKE